jgi:hypothetical protein
MGGQNSRRISHLSTSTSAQTIQNLKSLNTPGELGNFVICVVAIEHTLAHATVQLRHRFAERRLCSWFVAASYGNLDPLHICANPAHASPVYNCSATVRAYPFFGRFVVCHRKSTLRIVEQLGAARYIGARALRQVRKARISCSYCLLQTY